MNKLYVIDGHSQIYRACFANSVELHAPDGEPTKGTLYFLKMLIKLLREHSPTHVAIAADGPKKFLQRVAMYPEYKGNRGEPEEGMITQVNRIYEILDLLDVSVFRVGGWEADDVIASFVELFKGEIEIVIISRDKDMHQLLAPTVKMYDPMSSEWWTPKEVKEKWGVEPKRVVDVQALLGDPTDNLPGVPGFGEKRAKGLIAEYGSLKKLKKNKHKLTPALRKALEDAPLKLCKKLVKLNRDLPLDISLGDLEFKGLNMEAAQHIFKRLGFKRWA